MSLIKNGQPVIDSWVHLDDESAPVDSAFTVSWKRWLAEKELLESSGQLVGIRLSTSDLPENTGIDYTHIQLIVLDIPQFTDGRAFSQARILRDQLGYSGEIRARGDFLRDQMFFLGRVGVNAFEFPEGTDLQDRVKAFEEFTVTYQSAADTREALYQRR